MTHRRRTTPTRSPARAPLVAGLAAALTLSGCGTRVDHADIVEQASSGPVTLSPESIQALAELRDGRSDGPRAVATAPGRTGAESAAERRGAAAEARQATGRTGPLPAAAGPKQGGGPKQGVVAAAVPEAPRPAGCPVALAPVAVGHVGFFSGVLGPITGNMPTVLKAWAQDLNSRGGLACHPVTVYSADDGGDPARSAYLVGDMVERHRVVAFVAPVVAIPNGFLHAIAAAKVPAVGGPGFRQWRQSPWVFLESAAVSDQVFGLIRGGVEQGKRRLGLIHCVEIPECTEVAGDFKVAAPAAGADLVYSVPGSVTQPDYTGACLNARNAGVDQLAVFLDGASIGRVARSCEAVGYRPLLTSLAGLISPGQAADPLIREFGLATATGNAPWILKDTPGLRDYHRVLARWAPNTPPEAATIITFTAAKLLEAALSNVSAEVARGPITPDLVVRGLGGIRNESLGGLTVGLAFSPGQKGSTSSGCVFLEVLTPTGWTAPKGSRPVCR